VALIKTIKTESGYPYNAPAYLFEAINSGAIPKGLYDADYVALTDAGRIYGITAWRDSDATYWSATEFVNTVCNERGNIYRMVIGASATGKVTEEYRTKKELMALIDSSSAPLKTAVVPSPEAKLVAAALMQNIKISIDADDKGDKLNNMVSLEKKIASINSPFMNSKWAYVAAVAAGAIAGPLGIMISPFVLLLANIRGEYTDKQGNKMTPLAVWLAAGVVLTPACWIANQIMLNQPVTNNRVEQTTPAR
jgi:hypothetical protein